MFHSNEQYDRFMETGLKNQWACLLSSDNSQNDRELFMHRFFGVSCLEIMGEMDTDNLTPRGQENVSLGLSSRPF